MGAVVASLQFSQDSKGKSRGNNTSELYSKDKQLGLSFGMEETDFWNQNTALIQELADTIESSLHEIMFKNAYDAIETYYGVSPSSAMEKFKKVINSELRENRKNEAEGLIVLSFQEKVKRRQGQPEPP